METEDGIFMIGIKFTEKMNRVFVRFMISYLIILSLTTLVGGFAYNEALKVGRENAIEDGLAALEKGKDILEARIMEIESLIAQVNLEPEIISVLNIQKPLNTEDYYKLRKAYFKLSSYAITNNFIDNFCIFFRDSQVLISSDFLSVRVESAYNDFLEYVDISYDEWQKMLFENYYYREFWPVHSVNKQNYIKPVVTYIQSIPLGNFSSYKGVILVLIERDKMLEPFMTLDIEKHGWMYIADDAGNIIASYNLEDQNLENNGLKSNIPEGFTERLINGEKFITLHTSSSYMNWNYVAAIPARIFEEQVSSIRIVFTFAIVATIVIGIIMASYLAHRNSMPIRSLVVTLNDAVGTEDYSSTSEYDFIESKISQLIRSNKTLQEDLRNQIPFLQASFFERLLRGEFNHPNDIETAARYANIKIHGDYFIVILMRLNGYNGEITEDNSKEINIARVMATKVLKDKFGEQCFLHNVDEDKIAIILSINEDSINGYEDRIECSLGEIIDELQQSYNIRVSFGIGELYKKIFDISNSFRQAGKALEYKAGDILRRVIWFKNILQSSSGYYYPIDLEIRLMNLVKAGEEKEVLNLLKQLYIKNLIQSRLSNIDTEQFIYEMRGTIIKLKNELLLEDEHELEKLDRLIKEMDDAESVDIIYIYIENIYKNLCLYVNQKKQSQNDSLLKNVIEYVNSNYMDYSLCLYTVASEFDLTEKYLSHFFKERTGENFSAYVEKVRMQKAIELLEDSELSITDIARQAGYNNNNTFYKAFKRIYGVSPSEYRRQKQTLVENLPC